METFTVYPRKKQIFLSRGGGHIDQQLDIVSDTIAEDGTRTLIFKPCDMTIIKRNIEELVDLIAEQLGESMSKHFKAILYDSLKDYDLHDITRMINKIKRGEPVKAHKGCYRVHVGDGRTKRSDFIVIRE